MKRTLQVISQVLFLALFVVLIVLGKVQIWMGVFLFGVVISLFAGRIYCGYMCPINTILRVTTWIKKKLHIKAFKIPNFIKTPWLRFAFLGLFIAIMIFTLATGKKIPVLPVLVGLGVIISIFFPEGLWHRYLCPYGTILSLPGRKSAHYYRINQEDCISCGLCKKVCPAESITEENGVYKILKKDCLVCIDCEIVCKQNAIEYK